MDIRQLTHFVGVAEHGGFTKAAGELNISQPALTRSVRMLEEMLGVSLFERHRRGVALTQHGDSLFRHASLIINSIQTAKKEIQASKDGGWGEVRVGMASLFSNFLVNDAVSNAAMASPKFLASIRVGLFEDMAALLREGLIDLIVTTRDDSSDNRNIKFEELCQTTSVLVAGTKNPLSRKKSIELEELFDEPWAVLNHPIMDSFLQTFFERSGLSAPPSRVRTSSLNMQRSLIRNQYFIGFLPIHWVKRDLESGVLAVLEAPGMPLSTVAGIATRKSAPLNRSAELLIGELRNVAATLTE